MKEACCEIVRRGSCIMAWRRVCLFMPSGRCGRDVRVVLELLCHVEALVQGRWLREGPHRPLCVWAYGPCGTEKKSCLLFWYVVMEPVSTDMLL